MCDIIIIFFFLLEHYNLNNNVCRSRTDGKTIVNFNVSDQV